MLDPKVGQATLDFLSRVEIRGNEAPVFMACVDAIRAASQPEAAGDALVDAVTRATQGGEAAADDTKNK